MSTIDGLNPSLRDAFATSPASRSAIAGFGREQDGRAARPAGPVPPGAVPPGAFARRGIDAREESGEPRALNRARRAHHAIEGLDLVFGKGRGLGMVLMAARYQDARGMTPATTRMMKSDAARTAQVSNGMRSSGNQPRRADLGLSRCWSCRSAIDPGS